MRKTLSEDTERQVAELYVCGNSVREISKKTGISTGSVSNIIKKFSESLRSYDIHALHEFYTMEKRINITPNDAFNGSAVFSVLSKNNIECSNEFIEYVMVFARKNNLDPVQLINLCNKISQIQSSSDVSIDEMESYCNGLLEKKKILEREVSKIQSQYDDSKKNLSYSLQEKEITQKQLASLDGVIQFLEKQGIRFDEFDSIYNIFKNTQMQNYDIKQIVELLKQNNTIDELISQKESELNKLIEATESASEREKQMNLRYENLKLRHNSLQDSIKSVEQLVKGGVRLESIPVWIKILDLADMTVDELENNLRQFGSMEKMINAQKTKKEKLGSDIALIQKKKSSLEKKSNDLKLEIVNWTKYGQHKLNEITKQSESEIKKTAENSEQKISALVRINKEQSEALLQEATDYVADIMQEFSNILEKSHKMEHTLGEMKSLKPLFDLINGKFDPVTSVSQIMIILDCLYGNIKGTKFDRHSISLDILNLKKKLLGIMSYG